MLRTIVDGYMLKYSPNMCELNMENVGFMDSSGLAIVMGRRKLMQNYDGKVELRHLCGAAKKVFDMAGISKYVTVKEDPNESK